jgi:DNA-binding IclR family transcriptional regulator
MTIGLSAPAAYVLRSLMEHPQHDTARAIAAAAPDGVGIDESTARDALGELSERGLAAEGAGDTWQITDGGRAAQQPT